mmetsp:Transcript_155588/g.497481  ORF Transcript_155588/g.497481 Transcript_155588/m.497481 type:complete len:102 (-) Transcript_155588:3968-4273(-)
MRVSEHLIRKQFEMHFAGWGAAQSRSSAILNRVFHCCIYAQELLYEKAPPMWLCRCLSAPRRFVSTYPTLPPACQRSDLQCRRGSSHHPQRQRGRMLCPQC